MSLAFEQRELEGIMVVALKRQLVFGQDDIALRDMLTAFGQSGKISEVDQIVSSGLDRAIKHFDILEYIQQQEGCGAK